MYKLYRNIHLAFGLMLTPILLFYAISALLFSHHFLYPSAAETEREMLTLSTLPTSPINLAQHLATEHNIQGKVEFASTDSSGAMAVEIISKPGISYTVALQPGELIVMVDKHIQNTSGFIKSLHVTAGIKDKHGSEKIWGIAVLITAVFIIFISLSGLLMWIYHLRERRSGIIFLTLSIIYCVTVLSVLRFS